MFLLFIRRLNDWVPEVRAACRAKLPLITDKTEAAYVVEALSTALFHWTSWGRIEPQDRQALLETIESPRIFNAFKEKLITGTTGPMASVMAQIGRHPIIDKHLIDIATQAVQPAVRARAFRWLFDQRVVWPEGRVFTWENQKYSMGKVKSGVGERSITITLPFHTLLEKSATDRSSLVRRVAAEMLIRERKALNQTVKYWAQLFASDSSQMVAERGLFVLHKLANEA